MLKAVTQVYRDAGMIDETTGKVKVDGRAVLDGVVAIAAGVLEKAPADGRDALFKDFVRRIAGHLGYRVAEINMEVLQ